MFIITTLNGKKTQPIFVHKQQQVEGIFFCVNQRKWGCVEQHNALAI